MFPSVSEILQLVCRIGVPGGTITRRIYANWPADFVCFQRFPLPRDRYGAGYGHVLSFSANQKHEEFAEYA